MHTSTMLRMSWFIEHYVKGDAIKVLDIGSYDVNGSYKHLFGSCEYVGLDIEKGPNVDVVMESPYTWNNLENEYFDYIISGQTFEHIEYPWLTIKEIYRKLKPGGIICIIAPNSTPEHRYPFDCYRYFADGLTALAQWGGFTVIDVSVAGIPELDASPEWDSEHNDVCLIAVKGPKDLLGTNLPRLKYERRYSKADNLKLQYDFMYQWISMPNKQELLQKFLTLHDLKTIYIYGYGHLGELLHKELKEITKLNTYVIEKGREDLSFEENSAVLISLLDCNRGLKRYLDQLWKNIPVFYLDEIFIIDKLRDFLSEHRKIYIYGAGDTGRGLLDCLTRFDYHIDGFIVSDGRRTQPCWNDIEILELSEFQNDTSIGIIVAVVDKVKNEIKDLLINENYENFIIL